MRLSIQTPILRCKMLVGNTQTLELHRSDAGCFKQMKTVLLFAELPIQQLCQGRHDGFILAGIFKESRERILRLDVAVLCGGVKRFGEDALGEDLRVGALC